jgi:hypothetical protein
MSDHAREMASSTATSSPALPVATASALSDAVALERTGQSSSAALNVPVQMMDKQSAARRRLELLAELQALDTAFGGVTLEDSGLPPRTGEATSTGARTDAEVVAHLIWKDLTQTCDFSDQMHRLGPMLRNALPLSSIDGKPGGSPVFASEMLRYEGDFSEFTRALEVTTTSRVQLHHILVVTQASGSGKTKLAYAEGMSGSLVVLIRVVKQSGVWSGG